MNKDTAFSTAMYSFVTKNFTDDNKKKLVHHIQKFIDRNSDVLFNDNFGKPLTFTSEDKEIIHSVIGVTPEIVKTALKQSKFFFDNWKMLGESFFHCCFFILKKVHKAKDRKSFDMILLYLGFYFYMISRQNFFKFIPNENIIRYTLNVLNNKFYLKQYKTIIKMLEVILQGVHKTYSKVFDHDYDEDEAKYLSQIQSRIRSQLRRLSNKFYDVHKSGAYLNTEVDIDDKDTFFKTENNSTIISSLSKKTIYNFYSQKLNPFFIQYANKISEIGKLQIENSLNIMKKDVPSEELEGLIQKIIKIFLIDNKKKIEQIQSQTFFILTYDVFNKSNIKNEDIIFVKKKFEEILKISSRKFVETKRDATKQAFRKAIILYFVLLIQEAVKN